MVKELQRQNKSLNIKKQAAVSRFRVNWPLAYRTKFIVPDLNDTLLFGLGACLRMKAIHA